MAQSSMPVGSRLTILVVDDDEALLEVMATVLEASGYSVLSAHDGVSALEMYESHAGDIDVVVSDVAMPRMNGRQLYDTLVPKDSTTRFVFSTGDRVLAAEILGELGSEVPLLSKPWTIGQLTRAIAEAMRNASRENRERARA